MSVERGTFPVFLCVGGTEKTVCGRGEQKRHLCLWKREQKRHLSVEGGTEKTSVSVEGGTEKTSVSVEGGTERTSVSLWGVGVGGGERSRKEGSAA